MSKATIADAIRATTGCTVATSNKAAAAALAAMKIKLRKTGTLQISGFGTFRVVTTRRRRAGTNPRTGAKIMVRASKTVKFKPSKFLRKQL